jgi:lipopolysaccharide cholinephosphotransferase
MTEERQTMKFFSRIIDALPSSKRAARSIRKDIESVTSTNESTKNEIDNLIDQFTVLQRTVNQSHAQLDHIQNDIAAVSSRIQTHDAQMQLLAWSMLRHDGESDMDSRKQVFANMSPATGQLRLLQLSCAQLMQEFAELCEQNSITYWADFGTLLGAVRHQGFIPWDDDTDMGMPRDQIDRLQKVIREDTRYSKRFKVSVVYDPYAFSKQIRFMYNDPANPSFLDLFIYDYAPQAEDAQYNRRNMLREELIKELRNLPFFSVWENNGYLHQGEVHSKEIEQVFDRYLQLGIESDVITDSEHAQAIMFSYDNCTLDDYIRIYQMELILPTTILQFEGTSIAVPRNFKEILERDYGNIYRLPNDIVSHFDHVSRELFKNRQVVESLKRSINDPEHYLS